MPGLHLYVVEHDAQVAGTAYLNVIPNLTRAGAPYGVIENVVVDQDLRGIGLGKALMQATLDAAWAARCDKVMLMTGSTRLDVHAFYRACGLSPEAKSAFLARPG